MADRLKFKDFSPHIDVTFWYELENRKLHDWKLDEPLVDVTFPYPSINRSRHQIANVATISKDCFTGNIKGNVTRITGTLQNFNTIEQLQKLDKKQALFDAGAKLAAEFKTGKWEKMNFATAQMHTFSDLKTHKFYYILAFPALDLESPVMSTKSQVKDVLSAAQADKVWAKAQELSKEALGPNPFVVIPGAGDAVELLPFNPVHAAKAGAFVAFADPSSIAAYPGWPLRNIIAALRINTPKLAAMNFISLRETMDASVVFKTTCEALPESFGSKPIKTVGYCDQKINTVELGSMMDPAQLADSSAKLNLSLMKWRMMPEIELGKLQECKALLLGSGTLGCNIARNLMMWGVTNITMVDRGTVSYSNPVRQTLFEVSDVIAEGEERVKSIAAVKRLKKILPTINATGVNMNIRMPGHRVDGEEARESATRDIQQLEDLIKAHDVIFLLTDSRESRWLPTLLAAFHNKPVLNSALGFDSYLVMRHGLPSQGDHRLGCYFCNDVIAPMDSLTARTLDQQCTVTRPGVSAMASALTIELLASLYNHPLGFNAAAHTESGEEEKKAGHEATTCLGNLPHQIRGNVRDYSCMNLYGSNYKRCTACSPPILDAFRQGGIDFIINCINNPKHMEDLTGLTEEMAAVNDDHAGWDDDEFDD